MKRLTLSLASVAVLAACQAGSPAGRAFNSEAGSVASASGFGVSVIQNYQTQINPASAQLHLAQRFSTEVESTVNFAFNSATLEPAAQAALRRQANWIRQFPELSFSVYGHTDLVGSDAYNYQLGLARANAVVGFLASQGVDRSRLRALVSYGETRPRVPVPGPERANRRTVTEVSGWAEVEAGHNCCLNGQYAEVIFREYVASAVPPQTIEGISGAELATEQ